MRRKQLIAGVCVIAGVASIALGASTVLAALDSRSWPSTRGTVVRSEVVRGTNGRGNSRKSSFKPFVQYEYALQGQTHVADRLSFRLGIGLSRQHAESLVAGYPVGREVDVHYNPGAPDEATLERGANATTFAVPGFGLALLLIGGVMIVRRS